MNRWANRLKEVIRLWVIFKIKKNRNGKCRRHEEVYNDDDNGFKTVNCCSADVTAYGDTDVSDVTCNTGNNNSYLRIVCSLLVKDHNFYTSYLTESNIIILVCVVSLKHY